MSRRTSRALRAARGDRRTRRGHQPPLGAERVAALTARAAGALVGDEVIQRMTLVGHLFGAVRAHRRAQIGRGNARAGGRVALGEERGPYARARSRAARLVAGVGHPEVEGTPVRTDEVRTTRALRCLDGYACRRR